MPTHPLTYSLTHRLTYVIAPVMFTVWLPPTPALAALGDELFKLIPSAAADGEADRFGIAVTASGNIALIGARVDDSPINDAGSAYLFDATTGNELAMLTASDAASFDNFGWSVALDGNRALVGAVGGTGKAYLFDVSDPLNPVELRKLTAPDAALFELFGFSVAISGDTALIGVRSGGGAVNFSGSAWLFDVSTGNALSELTAADAAASDQFGSSVAIGGNLALIGSPLDDDDGGNSGAVYLFDSTTGNELAKLTASDAAGGDNFGVSVALSGNFAVVGSPLDDDDANNAGSAYVFDVSDPLNPVELHKLVSASPTVEDRFGSSVAIQGNTILVGALNDDDGGNNAGAAYLFDVSTGMELGKLTASDAGVGDNFGAAVAIGENAAVIGAPVDIVSPGMPSGSAYVFSAVPEPSTAVLLVAVLACITCAATRRVRSTE